MSESVMNGTVLIERLECLGFLGDRTESTYFLVAPELALATILDRHITRSHPVSSLPTARQLTTLYFDTKDHALARRSGAVKLRVREYGDAEPRSSYRPEPLLWIEVKVRTSNHTRKERFAVPSMALDDVLGGGLAELVNERLPSAKQLLWQLGHLLAELRPSCATRYRRQAWQDREGRLRITLDTELGFHRVLASRGGASLRDVLVEPAAVELGQGVVEIKHQRELPRWIYQMIPGRLESAHVDDCPFSKFLAATRAIHGPLEPTA